MQIKTTKPNQIKLNIPNQTDTIRTKKKNPGNPNQTKPNQFGQTTINLTKPNQTKIKAQLNQTKRNET